ncbi:hypothetical protein MBLNU230_g6572t1 [Neophaeotheca triangularis]
MSAILSSDDLNDFISPGVACIKPVETLPQQQPPEETNQNALEVTTEDKVKPDPSNAPPAEISLTDCLACSGCVTSAEAVLVSLQSHSEVLETLDKYEELKFGGQAVQTPGDGKIFVASVSPQTRASLAATYNVSEREAGHMIGQLLSGPYGLRAGGKNGSGFRWIIDTNAMREACLVAAADEVQQALTTPVEGQKKPVLTSACPGWICYAEKTHPHVLPHLSKLKSPQALTGTLMKSVLARKYGVPPEQIWHMAVMPCFDKKLEASRAELTSHTWHGQEGDAIRDVDCVITARELLMLAESRDISFPCLPRKPLARDYAPSFPDATLNRFLFSRARGQKRKRPETPPEPDTPSAIGTSGGYLHHVLKTQQSLHPGSTLAVQRGRNADVADYTVLSPEGRELFRAARYYGFRNIQNLVRRLKPPKASRITGAVKRPAGARRPGAKAGEDMQAGAGDHAYVEVMACPGGCTNGGGQIKVGDVATLRQVGGTGVENGSAEQEVLPAQKEWLGRVDEAYWSADSEEEDLSMEEDGDGDVGMVEAHDSPVEEVGENVVDGIDHDRIKKIFEHWAATTDVGLDKLLYTTFRVVESDVGKSAGDMEKVAGLAVAAGGGW